MNIAIDLESLRAVLAQSEPVWATAALSDPVPVGDGYESEIFGVTIGQDVAIILKSYHGAAGEAKARNEYAAMRWLADQGFPVPHVLALAADILPGSLCLIMERIQGPMLTDHYLAADLAGRAGILRAFCQLMVDLHALEWRTAWPDPAASDPHRFLPAWFDRMQAYVHTLGLHSFDPVAPWLREQLEAAGPAHLVVIHGDFHLSNILCDPYERQVVIDWTAFGIHDARRDLAWTDLLLRSYWPLPQGFDLASMYVALSPRPLGDLSAFRAFACLRRLVDYWQTRQSGGEGAGMRPETRDLMERQRAHYRAVARELQAITSQELPQVEAWFAD